MRCGGALCEQLINERLQLGFARHDPHRCYQLGSLAEEALRGPVPARVAAFLMRSLCIVRKYTRVNDGLLSIDMSMPYII